MSKPLAAGRRTAATAAGVAGMTLVGSSVAVSRTLGQAPLCTAQAIRYTLQNQNSGYCPTLSSGDNYVQNACVTQMNNRFALQLTGDGSYQLVLATVGAVDIEHPTVNQCLEVRGGSLSLRARVGRALCTSDLRQRWWLNWVGDGSFEVVNRRSGLCMDVLNASFDPGAQIIQYTCNGAPNEHWYFMNW